MMLCYTISFIFCSGSSGQREEQFVPFFHVTLMSRAVLVPAQKKGGLLHQLICRASGTTSSMSSKDAGGVSFRSTKQKFQASSRLTAILQKPSLISILEKTNGFVGSWCCAIIAMSRLNDFPSCTIPSGGAVGTVASFTLAYVVLPWRRVKLKSSMARKSRLL